MRKRNAVEENTIYVTLLVGTMDNSLLYELDRETKDDPALASDKRMEVLRLSRESL